MVKYCFKLNAYRVCSVVEWLVLFCLLLLLFVSYEWTQSKVICTPQTETYPHVITITYLTLIKYNIIIGVFKINIALQFAIYEHININPILKIELIINSLTFIVWMNTTNNIYLKLYFMYFVHVTANKLSLASKKKFTLL